MRVYISFYMKAEVKELLTIILIEGPGHFSMDSNPVSIPNNSDNSSCRIFLEVSTLAQLIFSLSLSSLSA